MRNCNLIGCEIRFRDSYNNRVYRGLVKSHHPMSRPDMRVYLVHHLVHISGHAESPEVQWAVTQHEILEVLGEPGNVE
ncbi:hypothetical protein [Cronobacter phage JC01]|uniref:Uncharacterized protein n=1 Tax=Cronobacter phage JC01 TaxID=2729575 RepID=A0A6M3YKM6_9CAUD|nr:hypothetical protein JT331_gp60 [Cronobacter phage JC01]QJI52296.1 hypothetical protein [Cronobacter phage JC01]